MKETTRAAHNTSILMIAVGSGIVVAAILILGTLWMGQSARHDTETAVRTVSNFYLQELAGRREQVVATNLETNIRNMYAAIGLLEENNLSDVSQLMTWQARMRQLYKLEKFAFVDSHGLIYTSRGTETNIDEYLFDYLTIEEPVIFVQNPHGEEKDVIIAIPVDNLPLQGETLVACFMDINMNVLLEGVSIQTDANATTFCNLYYKDGTSLTGAVLGGLSNDSSLMDALKDADFSNGYSLEDVREDFLEGRGNLISFDYDRTSVNMYYVPVTGTDWMLTYLIRDSIIEDQINTISQGIVTRSLIQTLLTTVILIAVSLVIYFQTRKNSQLILEKETSEAESRGKQQELEERLKLQEQLLKQERQQRQQTEMITAMASDYRSIYYVNLESNESTCYRASPRGEYGVRQGDTFPFRETFTDYANTYVMEADREGFLRFIEPENIRAGLKQQAVITYRYLSSKDGIERYEMLRIAGVRQGEDTEHQEVTAISAGFSDVDAETRDSMAQKRALSDALAVAEQANAAKTSFLSSMSHEIRTPMNAIIGLDSIALKEPNLPERTREQLEKICSP